MLPFPGLVQKLNIFFETGVGSLKLEWPSIGNNLPSLNLEAPEEKEIGQMLRIKNIYPIGNAPRLIRDYHLGAGSAPGSDVMGHPDIYFSLCSNSQCELGRCLKQCGKAIYKVSCGNLTHTKPRDKSLTVISDSRGYMVIWKKKFHLPYDPSATTVQENSQNSALVNDNGIEISKILDAQKS